ncbi:hypothetical protein SteCoe_21501 [Stentor coeruleus]|uniref:Uncharacterized protein n=1 Tax=Stentor coeruleus TaxID=5963 RepID=A0A1R2BPG5_9CILI|nr:hypothetical protein SteCoe_21501 [Stentor coeruleus]
MNNHLNPENNRKNRKTIRCKTEAKSPEIPVKVAKPKKVQPEKVLELPEVEDEYCELSIIYTSDEIFPDKFQKGSEMDLIKSARQSLIDLQIEAKNCLDTSKKVYQGTSKKLRMSGVTYESYYNTSASFQGSKDILSNLSRSIIQLNQRLSFNEEVFSQQADENACLKSEIKALQEKIREQQLCKLENDEKKIGCTGACLVM